MGEDKDYSSQIEYVSKRSFLSKLTSWKKGSEGDNKKLKGIENRVHALAGIEPVKIKKEDWDNAVLLSDSAKKLLENGVGTTEYHTGKIETGLKIFAGNYAIGLKERAKRDKKKGIIEGKKPISKPSKYSIDKIEKGIELCRKTAEDIYEMNPDGDPSGYFLDSFHDEERFKKDGVLETAGILENLIENAIRDSENENDKKEYERLKEKAVECSSYIENKIYKQNSAYLNEIKQGIELCKQDATDLFDKDEPVGESNAFERLKDYKTNIENARINKRVSGETYTNLMKRIDAYEKQILDLKDIQNKKTVNIPKKGIDKLIEDVFGKEEFRGLSSDQRTNIRAGIDYFAGLKGSDIKIKRGAVKEKGVLDTFYYVDPSIAGGLRSHTLEEIGLLGKLNRVFIANQKKKKDEEIDFGKLEETYAEAKKAAQKYNNNPNFLAITTDIGNLVGSFKEEERSEKNFKGLVSAFKPLIPDEYKFNEEQVSKGLEAYLLQRTGLKDKKLTDREAQDLYRELNQENLRNFVLKIIEGIKKSDEEAGVPPFIEEEAVLDKVSISSAEEPKEEVQEEIQEVPAGLEEKIEAKEEQVPVPVDESRELIPAVEERHYVYDVVSDVVESPETEEKPEAVPAGLEEGVGEFFDLMEKGEEPEVSVPEGKEELISAPVSDMYEYIFRDDYKQEIEEEIKNIEERPNGLFKTLPGEIRTKAIRRYAELSLADKLYIGIIPELPEELRMTKEEFEKRYLHEIYACAQLERETRWKEGRPIDHVEEKIRNDGEIKREDDYKEFDIDAAEEKIRERYGIEFVEEPPTEAFIPKKDATTVIEEAERAIGTGETRIFREEQPRKKHGILYYAGVAALGAACVFGGYLLGQSSRLDNQKAENERIIGISVRGVKEEKDREISRLEHRLNREIRKLEGRNQILEEVRDDTIEKLEEIGAENVKVKGKLIAMQTEYESERQARERAEKEHDRLAEEKAETEENLTNMQTGYESERQARERAEENLAEKHARICELEDIIKILERGLGARAAEVEEMRKRGIDFGDIRAQGFRGVYESEDIASGKSDKPEESEAKAEEAMTIENENDFWNIRAQGFRGVYESEDIASGKSDKPEEKKERGIDFGNIRAQGFREVY